MAGVTGVEDMAGRKAAGWTERPTGCGTHPRAFDSRLTSLLSPYPAIRPKETSLSQWVIPPTAAPQGVCEACSLTM
jgi:hypothetical protein